MRSPLPQFRFRAVSMELAAHFEDRRVDMLIVTEDGTTISIEYENDSILTVQEHIGRLSHHCPQIASWSRGAAAAVQTENAYDAALSEGWNLTPSAAVCSWRLQPSVSIAAPALPQ